MFVYVVIFLLAWVIAHIFKNLRYYTLIFKLPSITRVPFFGEMALFVKHRGNYISALNLISGKNGPIFRIWGRDVYTVIGSAEFAEIVFTHPSLADRGTVMEGFKDLLGEESLFIVKGEKVKKIKKIFVRTFNTITSKNNIESFKRDTDRLISLLEKEPHGQWLKLLHFIEATTATSIMSSALEADIESYPGMALQMSQFKTCLRLLVSKGTSPLHQIDYIYKKIYGGSKVAGFIEFFQTVVNDSVFKCKIKLKGLTEKDEEIPNKFIYNLLRERPNATNEEILQDAITVVFGALETSAMAICFVLTMLAIHQDMQQKVFEEDMKVVSEIGDRQMGDEDFSRYEYLTQVIKETLRLYPSAPVSPRYVAKEVQCGKYILPKGSYVIVSNITVQRDPRHYHEPQRFDPDRFKPENVAKRYKYCYIPFAAGQRSCPGYRYALQFSTYMVATIIRNFKIHTPYISVEDFDKNLVASLTIYDKKGFPMRLEKR